MNDFLNFDKLIVPVIIKIVFWIGVGLALLEAVVVIFTGIGMLMHVGAMGFFIILLGLFWMVLGPVLVRIICEIALVQFLIHEKLVEISKAVGGQEFVGGQNLPYLHQ